MHLLSAKSKYIAGINSCWPSTEATNWNPQRSDFMSMMMSCVCERAWTWDKFMNGRNHCKLQLLLVLLLLSLLFLWFMTKMKHDFVLHFTINCEEFPTGTMNWPPASRWMRHVLWTYNNCGADNCTASWREQNETIPFTTTAQTPPSHVILFFYDCGGGGGAVWLTDLQKEPHKKVLKYFSCFFLLFWFTKEFIYFCPNGKKEEKRRVSELENGVCVPGIQTIWTPARRRSLIVIVGGFFRFCTPPPPKPEVGLM